MSGSTPIITHELGVIGPMENMAEFREKLARYSTTRAVGLVLNP